MASRTYEYRVVDVFTATPFEGNPLAVFPDAPGLSDAEMQTLARELNLSESVFVFPPQRAEAAAAIRIFTSALELPFAGHPTIGTAFVLCALGRIPAEASGFVLDEGIGPVPIRLERRAPFMAWLRTPPITFGATYDRAGCASALGLTESDLIENVPLQVVSAGNPFLYVPLRTPEAVDRADLDVQRFLEAAPAFAANGVYLFAPVEGGLYSRLLAPMAGVPEDPATGSAAGPVAAYMAAHGLCERREGLRLLNEQGVRMRRRSHIHALLHCTDDALTSVEVGGSAVEVIRAIVTLP